MIHRIRWLCATVAAAALVAACGGGGHSSTTSTTSTTKVAQTSHTTTSSAASTTSTTSTTKSTTSSSVKLSTPSKARVLAACKSEASTLNTELGSLLPANFKSDINSICDKVANGNINGAKAIAVALCNQVVSALPSGAEKSAFETSCKSINKSSG
jgi:hypothetical protein